MRAPESIEVSVDDLITGKGKLKLNADDMDNINFIVMEAELLKR